MPTDQLSASVAALADPTRRAIRACPVVNGRTAWTTAASARTALTSYAVAQGLIAAAPSSHPPATSTAILSTDSASRGCKSRLFEASPTEFREPFANSLLLRRSTAADGT